MENPDLPPTPEENPNPCPLTCPQRASGITLSFGKNKKVHLDPFEIICFFLLCFPVGVMIREASKTSFEDSMKRIVYLSAGIVLIRKMPTNKIYERLLSVSLGK